MNKCFLLFFFIVFAFLLVESEAKLWPWLDGVEDESGDAHAEPTGDETDGKFDDEQTMEGDESEEGLNEGDPTEPYENVTELTDDNFDSTIKGKNVLVEFYASWCSACKQVAPIYKAYAAKFKNPNTILGKIDVDKNQKIGSRYEINGIPTFFLFKKDGTHVEFTDGPDEESFDKFINEQTK